MGANGCARCNPKGRRRVFVLYTRKEKGQKQIFNHLYPSQLSRTSMVINNLNKIVSSLSVWSHMFSVIFGPTKRLRLLRNMPESKIYMLYMCAGSLNVCEECLGLTLPSTAEPVLVLLPMLSKGNIRFLGEQVNEDWMIWMCQSCLEKQIRPRERSSDLHPKTRNRMRWYRQQECFFLWCPNFFIVLELTKDIGRGKVSFSRRASP